MAWNNLGVAFDQSALRAKSVDAYRKAEEAGETLAMSNLALKYLLVGFVKEAEEECNKALVLKDYHKNIGHTLAKLKDLPDEENKKQENSRETNKEPPNAPDASRPGPAAPRPGSPCSCSTTNASVAATAIAAGSFPHSPKFGECSSRILSALVFTDGLTLICS